MQIKLLKNTELALERMAELNALLITADTNDWALSDGVLEEYRHLQTGMVDTFLPLVQTLMRAGLLTLSFNDLNGNVLANKYASASCQVDSVVESGSILLMGGRGHVDTYPRDEPEEERPHPPILVPVPAFGASTEVN